MDIPVSEDPVETESILKPKQKRTLTEEQRLACANRMKAINETRLANKKKALETMKNTQVIPEEPPLREEAKSEAEKEVLKLAEKPKKEKKRRVVKVIELSSSDDDSSSDSDSEEEEIVAVKKKKPVKDVKQVKQVKQRVREVSQPIQIPPEPHRRAFKFL